MPKLNTLYIDHHGSVYPWDQGRVDILPVLSGMTSGAQLSHLTHLGFDCVYLSTSADVLVRNLEIAVLQSIEPQRCRGIATFLNGMSNRFTLTKGVLHTLALSDWPEGDQGTLDAIERFLHSCPKLSNLFLETDDSPLVDKACVRAHRETLTSLSVRTNHWPRQSELSTIKPIQAEALDWIARFLRASAWIVGANKLRL
jgi:hypothetical protein